MLRANRDQHLRGRDVDAAASDPRRAGLAMIEPPAARRIVEQRRTRRQRGIESRREFREVRVRRQRVQREVEQVVRRLARQGLNERAAPHLAGDQAAPGGDLVGASDGANGEAERVREVPLWRQPVTWSQGSGLDVPVDGVRNLLIDWAVQPRKPRGATLS